MLAAFEKFESRNTAHTANNAARTTNILPFGFMRISLKAGKTLRRKAEESSVVGIDYEVRMDQTAQHMGCVANCGVRLPTTRLFRKTLSVCQRGWVESNSKILWNT